VRSQHWTYKRR